MLSSSKSQSLGLLRGTIVDSLKDELTIAHDRLDATGEAEEFLTRYYNAVRNAAVLKTRFDARVQKSVEEMIPALEPQIRESANLRLPSNAGGTIAERETLLDMKTKEGVQKATNAIVEQMESKYADKAEEVAREAAEAGAAACSFIDASIVTVANPATLLLGGQRGLADLQRIVMIKDSTAIMSPAELAKLFASYRTLGQIDAAQDLMLGVEPRGVERLTAIRGTLNLSNGKNPNRDATVCASDEFNAWVALLQAFADVRKSNVPTWLAPAVAAFDQIQKSYEDLIGSPATAFRRTASDMFPTRYVQAGYSPMTLQDQKNAGYSWR
jgi:hypothetical protein